ncbi:hypothetical protein AS188_16240 (plasmid) [Kocuria flava]|uniref:Helix-turn-helix domain-containing protein n=1 Tax=Kocuria flava TaxID=446860 RepID=A0A0U3I106_9MICC|nr:helix-turn-helix domain-containing protein [Kocuria flava]ALU41439.1 hypothetical protein AS188_16240 [Kocuria flava]GEO93567.1 hypothetical protein KFL01_28730 [Kocuria flava]
MPHKSTERTAPVSTTAPVAPCELPAGVIDLDQARRVRLHGYDKFDLEDVAETDPNLTHAEFRTFMALWKHADSETLEARPTQGTIAKRLNLNDAKTAGRRIDALAAKGYLIVKRTGYFDKATGRNIASLYRLTMPAGAMTEAERKAAAQAEIRADSVPGGGVGVTTNPTVGVTTNPTGGFTTTPLTNQETNQETDQKNPAAATAPPPADSRDVDNSINYGRGGYDADGTPWESTVKAAWIAWAQAVGNTTAEAGALDALLSLIAARNGEDAADWARDYWGWHDARALDICLAPSLDAARYEAGAQYSNMLNAAAADPYRAVTVNNPPRVHRQQPVTVVDRDNAAAVAAEAEQLHATGQLNPDVAAWLDAQPKAAPATTAPAAENHDTDPADAEQLHTAQVEKELAARIAEQEAEDRRRRARARLDARYLAEAERTAAALEETDTASPQDWAEAAVLFADYPAAHDVCTAPEPTPDFEYLADPTPEDHAEFVRLFLTSSAA